MIAPQELAALGREELLALVGEVQRQIAAWRPEIAQLTRGGQRQAARLARRRCRSERASYTCQTAGHPVSRVGLSGHGVWSPGAWPASRPGAGGARWPRHPGAPRPHGLVPRDGGPAAAGEGTGSPQWRAAVPAAPVGQTADTGWRVGGAPACLMAFATEAAIVSQGRPRQRPEAGQAGVPAADGGVMVTARGRRYEAQALDDRRQHTCLAHLQRARGAGLATTTGRARDGGEGRQARRHDALPRWQAYHDGAAPACVTAANARRAERTDQLRARRLKEADNQRLRTARGGHHDRGHLVRVLDDPPRAPTNTRAPRARRPAVIARKGSPCAPNRRGPHAVEVFTRVVRTRTQQGIASRIEGR
jgi:hypothetical protein